jgi:hypothetical protein
MSSVKLGVRRFFMPYEHECNSVKDAIKQALSELDDGQSFPDFIEKDGIRIWEFRGEPMGVRESLGEILRK